MLQELYLGPPAPPEAKTSTKPTLIDVLGCQESTLKGGGGASVMWCQCSGCVLFFSSLVLLCWKWRCGQAKQIC